MAFWRFELPKALEDAVRASFEEAWQRAAGCPPRRVPGKSTRQASARSQSDTKTVRLNVFGVLQLGGENGLGRGSDHRDRLIRVNEARVTSVKILAERQIDI